MMEMKRSPRSSRPAKAVRPEVQPLRPKQCPTLNAARILRLQVPRPLIIVQQPRGQSGRLAPVQASVPAKSPAARVDS